MYACFRTFACLQGGAQTATSHDPYVAACARVLQVLLYLHVCCRCCCIYICKCVAGVDHRMPLLTIHGPCSFGLLPRLRNRNFCARLRNTSDTGVHRGEGAGCMRMCVGAHVSVYIDMQFRCNCVRLLDIACMRADAACVCKSAYVCVACM
jgi:hypothetical protein